MNYENFIVDSNNGISLVKINRPKSLNALSESLLIELYQLLLDLEHDDNCNLIILTGEGKAFVAGADISEMKSMTPHQARKFSKLGIDVFRKIETIEKPVIAAINGFALGGGCELAMACDIRIANSRAKFAQPEVSLGITPGFAGTQRLSRLVGLAKAKELIFTGKIINANEAADIGLVNQVVEDDLFIEHVYEFANSILNNSQVAVRYCKTAINSGFETDIETAMQIEKNIFGLCFANEHQKEGMEAFLEKRQPNFKEE